MSFGENRPERDWKGLARQPAVRSFLRKARCYRAFPVGPEPGRLFAWGIMAGQSGFELSVRTNRAVRGSANAPSNLLGRARHGSHRTIGCFLS